LNQIKEKAPELEDITDKLKETRDALSSTENALNAARTNLTNIQQEGERIKREADALFEQKKQEAEQLVNQAKEQANASIKAAVDNVVAGIMQSELGQIAKELGQKLDQIKQDLDNLKELTDLSKLKERALDEAEKFSEGYLQAKVDTLELNELGLKATPDVEFSLSGYTLHCVVNFYLLEESDNTDKLQEDYLVLLSITFDYDIAQSFNFEKVKNSVVFNYNVKKDEIKERIESYLVKQKDKLIEMAIQAYFSDIFALFKKVKQYLPNFS
ncbi:hypothetical protein U1F82_18905, partial [Bacillus sp. SXabc123]|nr:hypothetical protein [Bacillus sp. SXabc123]